MSKTIIERDGYPVLIYKVMYETKGFKFPVFVEGTYPEVHAYMSSEFGFMGANRAITDAEYDTIKKLKIPVYLAPQLKPLNKFTNY